MIKKFFTIYLHALLIFSLCIIAFTIYARGHEKAYFQNITECIKAGKVKGKIRLKHEFVSNEWKPDNANGVTFSGRLGYDINCGNNDRLHIFVETQWNVALVQNFNNTQNEESDFPVIGDPNAIQLNNAYIEYQALKWLKLKGGRYEKVWGDQSLIGKVAWRNLGTTFDGAEVLITPKFLADTSIELGYVGNWTNPINQNVKMNTLLGRIVYSGLEATEFTTHIILLNYEEETRFRNSSATYGLTFWHERPLIDTSLGKLRGRLDLALDGQSDYQDNPHDYTVYRVMMRGTFSIKDVSFYVKGEHLSTDGSGHSFQKGWTEEYFRTPRNGMNDAEIGMKIDNFLGGKLKLAGHFYHSADREFHYGDQLEVSYSYPLNKLFPSLPDGTKFAFRVMHFLGDRISDEFEGNDFTKAWGQIEVPLDY